MMSEAFLEKGRDKLVKGLSFPELFVAIDNKVNSSDVDGQGAWWGLRQMLACHTGNPTLSV